MLKTTEIDDIKSELKDYSKYRYSTQQEMDDAIVNVAKRTEIMMKEIITESYYGFLKNLNGTYTDFYQESIYYGEVAAIARDFIDHAVRKNQISSSSKSISIPGFSRSKGSDSTEWYTKDRYDLNMEFIKHMYTAGYKVNQARTVSLYSFNETQGVI